MYKTPNKKESKLADSATARQNDRSYAHSARSDELSEEHDRAK